MRTRTAIAALVVVGVAVPATPAPAAEGGSATFVVTTVSDDDTGGCDEASCTLREAITAANALPAETASTIAFALPGSPPFGIRPARPLPPLLRGTTIDGTTQPGYAGAPVVEINLVRAGPLEVTPAYISPIPVVRGLAVNRSRAEGIVVAGRHFLLDRSFVGTDVTGTVDRGNAGDGLFLRYVDADVVDSVVSGNGGVGIRSEGGSSTIVRGSRIGTDVAGTSAVPNTGGGVSISATAGVVADNVISGNGSHGVAVGFELAFGPVGLLVAGNRIGTDVTGTAPLANLGDGIRQTNATVRIGVVDAPNVIAANRGRGIAVDGYGNVVVEANAIGTDLTGTRRLGNGGAGVSLGIATSWPYRSWVGGAFLDGTNRVAFNRGPGIELLAGAGNVAVTSNLVHDNAGLAVDLLGDGVTANDPGDEDDGPNRLQNFPDIATATAAGATTTVAGTLDSLPEASFRVEVFADAACDASGHGEAGRLLGSVTVRTDGDGHASFDESFSGRSRPGQVVSATATQVVHDLDQATSELSTCVAVAAG
ncbi:MAG TPA: CSLREA domain-containing protein [Acidimicrobiales bacterium]|jgi:CSLREA domain-containing protein